MLKKLFLNEKSVLSVILINTFCIFLMQCGFKLLWLDIIDLLCTFFFLFEMIVKQREGGFKKYWKDGWNFFDGVLVIISLPSVVYFFFPEVFFNSNAVFVLRLFRVLRYFRLLHFFPNFNAIVRGFKLAMRESFGLIVGMVVVMIIFALLCCALFGKYVPEIFGTPWDSLYSIFRIFTGEGWNEIPDTVADAMGAGWAHVVRLFFSVVLLLCCIFGMSLLNSVFVDAMVADNNDNVVEKLDKMQEQLDRMEAMLKEQNSDKV